MRALKQSRTESIGTGGRGPELGLEISNWDVPISWDQILPDMKHLETKVLCDPLGPSGRIVATIGGPESPGYNTLEEIIKFGTIRVNLAFVSAENYEEKKELIRRIRRNRGDAINIMLDAVGPRVKLSALPKDGIKLVEGAEFMITTRKGIEINDSQVSTIFKPMAACVKPGHPILLAEGKMKLVVIDVQSETDVRCKVIRGGILKKRGINLPETDLNVPALSDRDREDLKELCIPEVDMIALSFVRTVQDVAELREFLKEIGRPDIRIMSKIETRQAVRDIYEIAAVSDALMVARGDLWAELRNPWSLPGVTCKIIKAGNDLGVPVITATQTLSSMCNSDLPSRAEVDELYFLLREGSDCIMGSEEFAMGKYPAETAKAILDVSKEVDQEKIIRLHEGLYPPRPVETMLSSDYREKAALIWAEGTARVKCIVVISARGNVARRLFKERPRKPVVVVTCLPQTARFFQLFGAYTVLIKYTLDDEPSLLAEKAFQALGWTASTEEQTALLIVSHQPRGGSQSTRFARIEEVPLPK